MGIKSATDYSTPQEYLNSINNKTGSRLKSFEDYKRQSKKPKEHFCTDCSNYYKNYNNKQLAIDPEWQPVFPTCTGSKEYMQMTLKDWKSMGGTKNDYNLLEINYNPVKWAAAELGFITEGIDYDRDGDEISMDRWYQKSQLLCSASLKVHRCGRRIGKCLAENTEIATPTGPVKIQDLSIGDIVYSYNPTTGKVVKTPVLDVIFQGHREVVTLTRFNKPVVSATLDHRFHTTNDSGLSKVRAVKDLYKGCTITRKFIDISMGKVNYNNAYSEGVLIATNKGSKLSKISISTIKTWNRVSCLKLLSGILDTRALVKCYKGNKLYISINVHSLHTRDIIIFLLKALFQTTPNISLNMHASLPNTVKHTIKIESNVVTGRIIKQTSKYTKKYKNRWFKKYEKIVNNKYSNEKEDSLGVIVDKESTHRAKTYDIEIGNKDHLYLLANGMVTHNSEVCSIEVLMELHTNDDFIVVLVAPFETQLIKFEEKLIGWIEKSATVKDNFYKYNKTKHIISFKNGSKIEGYCTGGDKQSKTADRVRGAGANMLVLDEADYISEDCLQAVLAVMSDDPKCKILLSSTPSGKRAFFYSWCNDKSIGFKEFHFYSHASPIYTKAADRLYRSTLSEDKYRKEYLGEFGTLLQALLKPEDINKTVEGYSMKDLRDKGPQSNSVYIIGVDWNGPRIGTNIIVLEYSNKTQKYKMVDKIVIKETEYNYENSCWAVIKSFEHWNASYVYVDFGFGEMQCEMIKKTAKETNNIKLINALVEVPMGGSQIIRDAITSEEVKKPTKEFAINLMINVIEQGLITLPYSENYKDDDEDWGIIPQLYDLAVEKYNDAGKPIYTKTVDHTMTALYLALLGFYMKLTDVGRVNYDTTTKIVSHGDLKELAGGIVIEGVGKRESDKKKDKGIAYNEYIPRDIIGNSISGPSYGGIPTIKSEHVEWENGVPKVRYDTTISSVPINNLGLITRKSF